MFYWSSIPASRLMLQFSSVVQSYPTLCKPKDSRMPDFPVHHQPPVLAQIMSIKSVMPSNHLILCLLLLLPSGFPSIRVFSSESVLHIKWPKYWSFSISPSNEYSGLISFKIARDSQEFKSIKSSELSFLYGPALPSIHDYWKNNSFN